MCPLVGVHHDILATRIVIVVNTYFLAYILLRDAEAFLHGELYGQSVRVPSRFALDLKAFHGLVSQNGVFYCPAHDMMDAGMPVGGRGTLKEDELRMPVLLAD